MLKILRPAIILFALLSIMTGIIYPLAVTAVAQVAFPSKADGSIIYRAGRSVGSELIGQPFTDPKYFWGRPSATSGFPYNAMASGGSNLGPTNPALADAVKARVVALQAADPGNKLPIPVDLVTASASGLDPDISPAAALYQVSRVARARGMTGMTQEQLKSLVARQTGKKWLGILGEERVCVLKINLDLDAR
ncbi:MAG TPA: potassium-transporting ATPase subunit KdpC [Nitrospirota bacterium]|jgi:K+-transporting ATPase ATPase C chain